jgi:hypothetical protein
MGERARESLQRNQEGTHQCPALGLPDEMKPFYLYVHERKGTAIGVLTQLLGSWHCLVTYLSKQLGAVS